MAEDKPTWNPEHLAIVLRGASALAEWRAKQESPRLELRDSDLTGASLTGADLGNADLSGADLGNADLSGAYLGNANLRDASLFGANLSGADLSGANLTGACLVLARLSDAYLLGGNLTGADLSGARLRRAYLMRANLSGASLRGAGLSHADLLGANLSGANLTGADLSDANLNRTNLSGANLKSAVFLHTLIASDLTCAIGLDDVKHWGPSHLSSSVLLRVTKRPWPIRFLRGCGLTDREIGHAQAMPTSSTQYYTCFIRSSSEDDKFAVKMQRALEARGIPCWRDNHELGDALRYEIIKEIRPWDKVLLLCSEHSLTSPWVRKEINGAIQLEDALEKEHGTRTLAIIPLDLDGFLFDQQRCEFDWAPDMRARHAAKFVGWENDEKVFDEQFARVVKALRVDDLARPKPPTPRL